MHPDNFIVEAMTIDITFDNQSPFNIHVDGINGMMVMIGQNGSGKTMFLTCTWFTTFLLSTYQTLLLLGPDDILFGKMVNDSLAMTFDGSESLSGMFIFRGQKGGGFEFILQFERGKLINFNIDMKDITKFKEMSIINVKFNSKDARQFSEYERYLTILEMSGIGHPTTIDDFKKISKLHKLFDILWFENIRLSFNRWEKAGYSEHAKDVIKDFHSNWPSDNDAFGNNPYLKTKDNIPYIISDTVDQKISTFGAGHQAVLMTTLFLND